MPKIQFNTKNAEGIITPQIPKPLETWACSKKAWREKHTIENTNPKNANAEHNP